MELIIDSIGGTCPLQAEGTINGIPFYFRSRHDSWSMSIGEDPVSICVGQRTGWHKEELYGYGKDASFMPIEEARNFIEKCAEEYTNENIHNS